MEGSRTLHTTCYWRLRLPHQYSYKWSIFDARACTNCNVHAGGRYAGARRGSAEKRMYSSLPPSAGMYPLGEASPPDGADLSSVSRTRQSVLQWMHDSLPMHAAPTHVVSSLSGGHPESRVWRDPPLIASTSAGGSHGTDKTGWKHRGGSFPDIPALDEMSVSGSSVGQVLYFLCLVSVTTHPAWRKWYLSVFMRGICSMRYM